MLVGLWTLNGPKKLEHAKNYFEKQLFGKFVALMTQSGQAIYSKGGEFFFIFFSHTIITIVNASFKCDFNCGELSEFNVIINVFPYICFAAISPLHQPAYPILDCDAEAQLKALNGFIMVIDPNSEVFYVSETVEQYLVFHQVSWLLYTFKFFYYFPSLCRRHFNKTIFMCNDDIFARNP